MLHANGRELTTKYKYKYPSPHKFHDTALLYATFDTTTSDVLLQLLQLVVYVVAVQYSHNTYFVCCILGQA